jgi:hypothetical protein
VLADPDPLLGYMYQHSPYLEERKSKRNCCDKKWLSFLKLWDVKWHKRKVFIRKKTLSARFQASDPETDTYPAKFPDPANWIPNNGYNYRTATALDLHIFCSLLVDKKKQLKQSPNLHVRFRQLFNSCLRHQIGAVDIIGPVPKHQYFVMCQFAPHGNYRDSSEFFY